MSTISVRCWPRTFYIFAALQALAAVGTTSLATIMLFSGHSNVDTPKRYLNWGSSSAAMREEAQQAAAALAQ